MQTKTAEATAVPMEVAPAAVPAVMVQESAIFQIIERAAKDPAVDIDKMERLIAMHERMQGKQAQAAYDSAMAEAQKGMKAVRTNAHNSHTKSKYATYSQLDKALRPIYSEHGFSLSFDTGDSPGADCVRVLCKVAHISGHRETHHIDMPADGKGPTGASVMTKTHATGSAVTYGKRYLLGMIFNIAVGDDDDGNKAGRAGTAGGGTEFRPERRNMGEMSQGPIDGEGVVDDVLEGLKRWASEQINLLGTLANNEDCRNWEKKNRSQLAKLWKADPDLWKKLEKAYSDSLARTAAP